MCDLCRLSEDKQRNRELRDYTRFVEGDPAPPRKSRKGHSRVRWCKGHIGKEHSWKLLPNYTDGGPEWYYRMGMRCENCQKVKWIDGPLAWGFAKQKEFESKDIPVECRACRTHVKKVPYERVRRYNYIKKVGGGYDFVPEMGISYRAPDECPFCGNGKKKIAATGRETHKARQNHP